MKKNITLLVVEDDELLSSNLIELLTSSGYQVVSATNGIEGLNLIKKKIPDLIICDVMMRGMDGFTLLKKINETLQISIPFIFLTAKTDASNLRQGMNLGADDYIFKPYKAEELLTAIEVRLNKFIKASSVITQKASGQLSSSDIVFINENNKNTPLLIRDIKFISANGDYSNITSVNIKNIIVKKTLIEWEGLLPENQFLRIHRSTIVNLEHITKIEKGFNRGLFVEIRGHDESLIASSRYSAKLKEKIM
ncbi:MAG TPA: response regulator [Ignavibacteriaceae bacterium]|nr:response regulator [Ignavibacteriaceae bacterium]